MEAVMQLHMNERHIMTEKEDDRIDPSHPVSQARSKTVHLSKSQCGTI